MTFKATPAAGATAGVTCFQKFYSNLEIFWKNETFCYFLLHLWTKWKLKMCQKSGWKIVVINFYVMKFILLQRRGKKNSVQKRP